MELVIFLIAVWAVSRAWKDSKDAYAKSKSAYMGKAKKRFPDAPKSRRAATALRHDVGYWASQALGGFPVTRHGFAAGWHQGRTAQASARNAREEARTRRLENQAEHAESLSGFRERQQEALRRWREAMNADRGRTTEGTVTGEGSEGSGEGSAPSQAADVPEYEGGTYSWGPANSPYGWPAQGDADKAHHYARRMSEDGNPQVVTVYPPGGGPGTTAATYLDGEEIEPTDAQRAEWWAEAEETRRQHPGTFGESWNVPDRPYRGDCYLCGLPLGPGPDDDGYSHVRCDEVYERDSAAHEVTDNRDLEDVEGDLRENGRCPWQIRAADRDGSGRYCGRPITDTGGDRADEFCLRHQAEADGDDEGATQELNEHVQELLQAAEQQESPASAQAASSTEGEQHMASDTTYDGVLASMAAEKASAGGRAAEQQQAAARASVMADQMQALEVDPATLSAVADHLDANDAAGKALQRVEETAAAVEATLQRGHSGLNEAHQNAAVAAADRGFYEGWRRPSGLG